MGRWADMNGDGRLDYLTARTNTKKGELVYFEHPVEGLQLNQPWAEHIIVEGPDVMFEIHEIKGYENSYVIFAAEFFGKKLAVYQIEKGTAKVLKSKIIDATIDQVYSVHYTDIDADGKMELLVNNHETNNKLAAIFLYSVPADIFGDVTYAKKTIASGFKNAFSLLIPNMCPGFPYAVYPYTPEKGKGTAHILVAGDGDQSVHLMRPFGQGVFNRETIEVLGGTVGSLTTFDFDNDGWLEILVPNYDKGYINVYQFYDGPN